MSVSPFIGVLHYLIAWEILFECEHLSYSSQLSVVVGVIGRRLLPRCHVSMVISGETATLPLTPRRHHHYIKWLVGLLVSPRHSTLYYGSVCHVCVKFLTDGVRFVNIIWWCTFIFLPFSFGICI